MKNNKKIQSELKGAIFSAKKSFISIGVFSLFINLLMLVPPLYMLQLYDRVITSRSESTLYMLTFIVVILFVTMALLEIVRSRVLIRIGNKIDAILSKRVFNSLFELANKNPSQASAMPLNDLTSLRQFMTGNGAFAFFDAPWIPIYITVLFLFHPYFGYFAIFAAIVLLIFTLANERSTKEKLLEANTHSRAASQYVTTNLRNAEVVYAMGMKNNIKNNWEEKHHSFLNAQTKASENSGKWTNISKSTRLMFQSLMLGLGGYLAIQSEVSPGMMIAGSIIMGRALAPLDLLINSWKGFSGAREAYGRLDELLDAFPKDNITMELPPPVGELVLERVIVTPPNAEQPSLKGVTMKVDKGDIVGIIGASASGKSSLARVMLGLWPLLSGKVRLDGADIHQWNKEELGQYIGYLPQDIELFEGSVSQNIARFNEVDAKKVIKAAKKAGVHEMILKLPEGYDSKILSGGSSLSGGQRQRIALARALYDNPVLVVLDEPNSNLDDIGEAALVDAIEELKDEEVTVILITHRQNILKVTTKLAMLNQGELVAYGKTNEVLEKLGQVQKKVVNKQVAMPKISLSKPKS